LQVIVVSETFLHLICVLTLITSLSIAGF
jgi:hypothetical protein